MTIVLVYNKTNNEIVEVISMVGNPGDLSCFISPENQTIQNAVMLPREWERMYPSKFWLQLSGNAKLIFDNNKLKGILIYPEEHFIEQDKKNFWDNMAMQAISLTTQMLACREAMQYIKNEDILKQLEGYYKTFKKNLKRLSDISYTSNTPELFNYAGRVIKYEQ